ncbi:serine/threonine-protein kinase [Actinoplanes sp. DH11]|uniref:serine/threonine-protein kinase n=1 Tax=Actinoplanes sp. DH11 TaxID=2857011 RepID=UPI001E552FEA|nr:serine/threonine-protein kinase [Actinoplanes sp. DH11]
MVRPIGQGATGTVWRGEDRATGEPVAIKLLHDSLLRQPRLVTRFVQERTILLMLRHRNVVRVRDLFSAGESLGLVMDLVAGGSLREHLHRRGTFAPAEAVRLAGQVASALAEAHDLGIIHRDLKPDNILLGGDEGDLETRLTDFGIARILTLPSMTTPNAVVGTPHYMAPEAFHGATPSPATDVYALGVLLYELVTGMPPYRSDSIPELMRLHVEADPERRPGIPDPLWRIIKMCLAGKPRQRPSAADLVTDLTFLARNLADTPALPRPGGPAAGAAVPSDGDDLPVLCRPAGGDPDAPADDEPAPAGGKPGSGRDEPGSGRDERGSGRDERGSAGDEAVSAPGGDNLGGVPDSARDDGGASAEGRALWPVPRLPLPRRRHRGNAAPAYRWSRPGATAVVVAGTMLASGIATTAWHLGRSGTPAAAPPAMIAEPSRPPFVATTRASAAVSAPAPRPPAQTTRTAHTGKATTGVAHPAPRRTQNVRATRPAADRNTADRGATNRNTGSRSAGSRNAGNRGAANRGAARPPQPEGRAQGRWQCSPDLVFDTRSRTPIGLKRCHQLGEDIQFQGALTAPAGGRGRIEVALQDTRTGRTVAGPRTCTDLSFTRRSMTQECGPLRAEPQRGREYAVVMTFRYIRHGRIAQSTSRGRPFSW